MGGGAAPSAVAAALTALRDTGVPVDVQAISSVPVPGFEVRPPTPDLPALFAAADLVVSAAGVTLLELCCIGVPTALVQVADNQAAGYAAAVAQGLAVGLGTDPRDHVAELTALLTDPAARAALASKAMTTVDGRGADRILDAAARRLTSVRPATMADAELLLAWRNDPDTRAWSRTGDTISLADHRDWLATALTNPERVLLIAEYRGRPVGTVRFDFGNDAWEVSITLAPSARGQRLALPVLLTAEAHLDHPTIHATVHRDNAASLALFQRAGYRHESADGVWLRLVKSLSGVS
jgi:RimJ/RimL family protein N-acetyltransferase